MSNTTIQLNGVGDSATVISYTAPPLPVPLPSAWTLESTGAPGRVNFGAGLQSGVASAIQVQGVVNGAGMLKMGSLRDSILWAGCEQVKGQYTATGRSDVIAVTNAINQCISSGINPVITLKATGTGTPGFYTNLGTGDDTSMSAFAAFCGWAVKQWPQVTDWELMNEFDASNAGPMPADRYAICVARCYDKMKAARPACNVIIGATVGPYWSGNAALWNYPNAAAKCDAISFHVYGPGSRQAPPEGTGGYERYTLDGLAAIDFALKAQKNYSITECGWTPLVYSYSDQVKMMSRWLPIAATMPRMVGYSHYNYFDDGSTSNLQWGLFSGAGVMKTTGIAFSNIVPHLHWGTTRKRYRLTGDGLTRAVKLSDGATNRAFLWSTQASAVNIALRVDAKGAGTLTRKQINGAAVQVALVDGVNNVPLLLSDCSQILTANVPISFPELA